VFEFEASFPLIVKEAAKWAARWEKFILQRGTELNSHQLNDARVMGVRVPEKIRVLPVLQIPRPEAGILQKANEQARFLTEHTAGLTLRYGIFIRRPFERDRRLLAHELAHVEQYERFGGFELFLREYLMECLTAGYENAALETEAEERSGRLW
jgi:hypothetical protein